MPQINNEKQILILFSVQGHCYNIYVQKWHIMISKKLKYKKKKSQRNQFRNKQKYFYTPQISYYDVKVNKKFLE